MSKVALELSEQQAERLLKQVPQRVQARVVQQWAHQMPPALKLQLLRQWERGETWPERFRQLLGQIQARVRQHPRLAREALQTIEPMRRAHARSHRR